MHLSYKNARIEDFEGFFKIKCDPQNVKWSGFSLPPNKVSLYYWYIANIKNLHRKIFLVWNDDIEIVGFFYLDIISERLCEATSSGVLTEYTNKGIGTKTLQWREEIAYQLGAEMIQTWVSQNNIASYHRLEKLNWIKTDVFELKHLPLAGWLQRFYKWQKHIR